MSLLAPLFLVGLSAIAIPVLIHLIQRERKRVIQFPSLMFLQRIPYQSVRRRRIRHWLLLALRAAALALLVLAFARPFFPQGAVAAAALNGAREVVIVLDNSASMGYGDHWDRARAAARRVVDGLGANDRGTLILFGRNAEERVRATSDRAGLTTAINGAKVSSDATRFGPALKLAESILSRSNLKRREAVLISDFQKIGWGSAEDARFPDGMTLTTESVAGDTGNINVPSVQFARTAFSGQERIVVTAGVTNRSDTPATEIPVTLTIDGHDIETKKANVAPHASASVTFAPFTVGDASVRGIVKAGTDPLMADNSFNFVAAQSEPVSVLIVDSGDRSAVSLYLQNALAIGTTPAFQTEIVPAGRVTAAMLDKRSVVVFNDTVVPSSIGGDTLRKFLERGGGILVVAGDRSSWLTENADLLPGRLGPVVDRTAGRSATLGYLDYSHLVFEIFKAARSGDFSSTHIFRYRSFDMTSASRGSVGSNGSVGAGASKTAGSAPATVAPDAPRVLARYDDGAVAAAEKRTGAGRLVAWTSMFDYGTSSDLAVKPIFLPLVHQLVQYLSRYEQTAEWMTVGQVLDLNQASARIRGDRIIVTPAGVRSTQRANTPGLLELNEQGVYDVRPASTANGRPQAIAVNLDPAESDLSALDPKELVATVTGRASKDAAQPTGEAGTLTSDEAEKRQGLWWYLLFGGLLLLAAETAIGNHLSRKEKFL